MNTMYLEGMHPTPIDHGVAKEAFGDVPAVETSLPLLY